MEEGDYFAIEPFGSTGRGHVVESVSRLFWALKLITGAHGLVSLGRMLPLCESV